METKVISNEEEAKQAGYSIVYCDYCKTNPAIKTNGESKYECRNKAETGSCEGRKPYVHVKQLQNRNDSCNCGSGKKFKKCCINKSQNE